MHLLTVFHNATVSLLYPFETILKEPLNKKSQIFQNQEFYVFMKCQKKRLDAVFLVS